MFLGINMFWAVLRAYFSPRLTARAKMSLSRAQNIFMPVKKKRKLYCFINPKIINILSSERVLKMRPAKCTIQPFVVSDLFILFL